MRPRLHQRDLPCPQGQRNPSVWRIPHQAPSPRRLAQIQLQQLKFLSMEVNPGKENIDQIFGTTTFYIDFYQRQYKWNDEPVNKLLDDVFYKFNDEHRKYSSSDIDVEQLIEKYGWYYLNTYVTNKVDGKEYIVDGQQRLTTLTLILMKLREMARKYHSQLEGWIGDKIVGRSGYKTNFWMNHEPSTDTMNALYQNGSIDNPLDSTLTSKNMVANYRAISSRLERELPDGDLKRFDAFVFYFLKRLVLIRLDIAQTDVPMVFEVINDRGVRLKPYEILKGKLLGQIEKEELKALKLDELWDKQVAKINALKDDEIDQFFIYFLRAKFANTTADRKKYDSDYHRTIMSIEGLGLDHNPKNVKKFLTTSFKYYTNLYEKIRKYRDNFTEGFEYLYYNGLTQMDTQYMLVMSACTVDDPEEDEKIKQIAFHVDRLFCLLQLQRSYDSNEFGREIMALSAKIRECETSAIQEKFNETLLAMLSKAQNTENLNSVWNYSYFKNVGYDLDKRFLRYVLARLDLFISQNTNMKMRHNLYDLVINRGAVYGFHVEHILARRQENVDLFTDEETFNSERNRLGDLLLLKGPDNQASGNEPYSEKLKTYANTLYWNETLRKDSYENKLDFIRWIERINLGIRPMDTFGPNEIEERHRLMYELFKLIWAI